MAIATQHSPKYQKYLRSSEWRKKREAAITRAGNRCAFCGRYYFGLRELDVHHLTYERLGAERDDDLQVVCHWCHGWADETRRFRQRVKREAALWAARLDGWASKVYGEDWRYFEDAEDVEEQFREWLDTRG